MIRDPTGSLTRAGASECRTATQPFEIEVFDFLSSDHVHLPFNEGYLRILKAAYPDDRISFRAGEGHVERLASRVADLPDIIFKACKPFETPFGLSHHNPFVGRWTARQCLSVVARHIAGRRVRLTALLGFNASLLAAIGHRWPSISSAPLHMILHSHLGEAMDWRSRNPLIRATDLVSQLGRRLPPPVYIVALELGMKEAIADSLPAVAPAIVTLEHPILCSEWAASRPPAPTGKVKIGFVGHARRAKGFDLFVELARSCSRDDIEFHVIGHSSPETDHLDTSKLARTPSRMPLFRDEYLAALQAVDLVCLPLPGHVYDFTGSGTVSDALAALKPLIVFRNRTMEAIFARYGPIGWLADNRDDLFRLVGALDPIEFARSRSNWVNNLRAIREARRPELLARSYAASIKMADESRHDRSRPHRQ
jgi:Glycosyl transferases group 1